MANLTEEELQSLKLLQDQLEDIISVQEKGTKTAEKGNSVRKQSSKLIKQETSLRKDQRKIEEQLIETLQNSHKIDQKLLGDLKKKIAAQKQLSSQLQIVRDAAEGYSGQLKKANSALQKTGTGTSKAIGTIKKLTGALGITGISFGNLTKAGLAYNRSLFEVSRGLQVTGQGTADMTKAMKKVRDATTLSDAQFIQLANTIQSSFVGIKPQLTDMVNLAETIGMQMGYSFEAQQKAAASLMSTQSKMPSMYSKIYEVSEKLKKAQKSGGGVSDELQAEIEATKTMIEQKGQLIGMTQQERDVALQMITERSSAMKALMDTEKAAAEATKEMDNARIELFQTLQPMIIGATKGLAKLVKTMSRFKEIVIGLAGAFALFGAVIPMMQSVVGGIAAMKTAMAKFGLATTAAAAPVAGILIAVLAVGAAVAWVVAKQRKAREEQVQQAKQAEILAGMEKDRASLVGEAKKQYLEQWKALDKSGMSLEDQAREHDKILQKSKEENTNAAQLARKFEGIKKEVGAQLDIINKINAAMKTQISVAEEFGMVNEEALQNMAAGAKMAKSTIEKELKVGKEALQGALKGEGLEIDLGGSPEQMMEQLNALEKGSANLKDRETVLKSTAILMDTIKRYSEAGAAVTKSQYSIDERRMRQQEQSSKIYEDRLNTQRKLMESAQFGLGASVEMMQKQVDLAYEFMKTYEQTDQAMQQRLKSQWSITDAQIEQIQNAKTQAEAESTIASIAGDNVDAQQDLNKYAMKHQEISKKSMEQQQKIYDLTKNIREGYLDAIREMGVGAGEFEKIIGSQEVGVTQLMGAVKDVTGEAKLNTMALGGLQEQALTAEGVGTQVAGKYTTSGLSFIGKGDQEARNQRIYKYGESKEQAEAAMRGEATRGGVAPNVGSGVAAGREPQYMRPAQEEKNITAEGVLDGLNRWSGGRGKKDLTDAVNVGVKKQNFSKGEVNALNKGGAAGGGAAKMGAQQLGKARGGGSPSGGYTTAGDMPVFSNIGGKASGAGALMKRTSQIGSQNFQKDFEKDVKKEILKIAQQRKARIEEAKEKVVSASTNKEQLEQKQKDLLARQGEIADEGSELWKTKKVSRFGMAGRAIGHVLKGNPISRLARRAGRTIEGAVDWGFSVGDKRSFSDHVEDMPTTAQDFASSAGFEGDMSIKERYDKQASLDKERANLKKQSKKIEAQLSELKSQKENVQKTKEEGMASKDENAIKEAKKRVEQKYARQLANTSGNYEQDEQGNITKVMGKSGYQQYGKGKEAFNKTRKADADIYKRLKSLGLDFDKPQLKATGKDNREEAIRSLINDPNKKFSTNSQRSVIANMQVERMGEPTGGQSRYDKEMAERARKFKQDQALAQKTREYKKGVGVMESERAGGYESADEKRGLTASKEARAAYEAGADQREAAFGLSSEGGSGGGGGSVKITISLASGLQGVVDKAVGVMAEIENA